MNVQAERREHPRFATTSLPIHFSSEMLDFDSDARVAGEVSDVGCGGLFIRCDFLEVPGTRVKLQLLLPDGPVEFRGVVAWVAEKAPSGPGMGISLTFKSPLEQAVLEHCRAHQPTKCAS